MQASMNAVAAGRALRRRWWPGAYVGQRSDEQTGVHFCHYHGELAGLARLVEQPPGAAGSHGKYGYIPGSGHPGTIAYREHLTRIVSKRERSRRMIILL